MIDDKIPEIVEEFTLTVIKPDGTRLVSSYDQDKPVIHSLGIEDAKLNALAKEILNERWRKD